MPLLSRLPFDYRTLLMFSIPLLIWLLVSIGSVLALREAENQYALLIKSQETLGYAIVFRNVIEDMRKDERTFLLTSAETSLREHRAAMRQANDLHEELKRRVRNQPEQMERLKSAGEHLQEWYYDVSLQRVQARRELPHELAHNANLLKHRLLAMLTEETPRPPETTIESLAEPLRALLPADRESPFISETIDQLDGLERELESRDIDNIRAGLRAIAARLLPGLERIVSAEQRINASLTQDYGPALVRDFREAMTNFIEAEQASLEELRAGSRSAAHVIKWTIWAGLIAGVVTMLIVFAWFARRIERSIASIDDATEQLVQGNLRVRANVEGRVDQLTDRFNRLADLIERRHRETQLLGHLGEALHNCAGIKEALEVFGQFAERLFPDQGGVLYLVEANGVDVTAMASWRDGLKYTSEFMVIDDCWGLRLSRIHENGGDGTLRCKHLLQSDRDSLCMRLPAFGETIGLLFVLYPAGADKVRRKQMRQFVDVLAEQVALALANVRLRETLRNQSIHDPLTQLYNRRHLEEVLERELQRAERHGTPLSAFAFDIDHFKDFNDEHGHDGGDAVLKCIGETLRDFFRSEDDVFRAGGEEFVTILPGTTHEDAMARAEELREKIANARVIHGNIHLPSVTVSIGVASYPQHGETAEQLLKAADMAQYAAKDAGRNCIRAAEDRERG